MTYNTVEMALQILKHLTQNVYSDWRCSHTGTRWNFLHRRTNAEQSELPVLELPLSALHWYTYLSCTCLSTYKYIMNSPFLPLSCQHVGNLAINSVKYLATTSKSFWHYEITGSQGVISRDQKFITEPSYFPWLTATEWLSVHSLDIMPQAQIP